MTDYNNTYKTLSNNWRNASYSEKQNQVRGMIYMIKNSDNQEIEFATRDFMDRWVYGCNLSLDHSSLKCNRGFAQYDVNKIRRTLIIDMDEVAKIEAQRIKSLKLMGYNSIK